MLNFLNAFTYNILVGLSCLKGIQMYLRHFKFLTLVKNLKYSSSIKFDCR